MLYDPNLVELGMSGQTGRLAKGATWCIELYLNMKQRWKVMSSTKLKNLEVLEAPWNRKQWR